MLVEFKTVRGSLKEDYEREKEAAEAELIGGDKLGSFFNKQDYISKVSINITDYNLESFWGGKVYFNDKELECTFFMNKDHMTTTNLIISYDEFKVLYEKITNQTIKTAEELLQS